uniref:Pyrin domain-containing protein n=1 Tax=Mastacembelus armatus TaxID=205130 RepID=A0A7N8XZ87_9TELE
MGNMLKDLLVQELSELTKVELWRVHWCLSQDLLQNFPPHFLSLWSDPIPVSRLESADRTRTVDLMVQQYHAEGAKAVTEEILRRMNKNQLADRLMRNS